MLVERKQQDGGGRFRGEDNRTTQSDATHQLNPSSGTSARINTISNSLSGPTVALPLRDAGMVERSREIAPLLVLGLS
jgi:hypothetical protein